VIGGDDMAFELLYARHVVDALTFARGVLGSQDEAEEAVRHSFAATRAYLAEGRRRTAFEPWLHEILDSYCLSVVQRRRADPPGPERDATVVDIDDWRRRRKLLGAALPAAPSAGFGESAMTTCGIGAGAATATAPLLGGTLAKVAVVALLAGGAGVAGGAASDPNAPVEAHVAQAQSRPAVDPRKPGVAGGLGLPPLSRADDRAAGPDPSARSKGQGALELDGSPAEPRERVAALVGGTMLEPLDGESTGLDGDARTPAVTPPELEAPADVPTPSMPDPSGPLPVDERLKERLPSMGERLKARPPGVGTPPEDRLPAAARPPRLDLPSAGKSPRVLDDGAVTPVKPQPDLRAPLRRGGGAPPR
jgi:hypothetical protein